MVVNYLSKHYVYFLKNNVIMLNNSYIVVFVEHYSTLHKQYQVKRVGYVVVLDNRY